jgi:His-Xaa-Ser system protein HxsD
MRKPPVVRRSLSFDRTCYSADAVQRALYRFSDRLSGVVLDSAETISCVLHIHADDQAEAELVLSDFRNEVLDQVLRERIRNETAEVRNLILALAFSDSGLLGPEARG